MGLKIVIADNKKRTIFENNRKGITDFIFRLNTELTKNGYDMQIGIFGEGWKVEEDK